jgi:predicted ATPase
VLREPEKLALTRYLDLEKKSPPKEATEIDDTLRYVRSYQGRALNLYLLTRRGSESSYHTWLWPHGQNLWSVLRNIHGQRAADDRYDTIIELMRKSFPQFKDLLFEQIGPGAVIGSFLEKGRRHPIKASGVSDGHLQMLLLLTALFSEGRELSSIILLDEPDISLHPHALAILAKAIKIAAYDWGKQVFIATHSPVLMSQFDVENIFAVSLGEHGQTVMRRVDEMPEIKDLLEDYAVGSLYMAQAIAPQEAADEDTDEVRE